MANRNLNWIYNAFNFLEVWLPYGTKSIIYDPRIGQYEVTEQELKKRSNNESLTGIDVTVFHPKELVVNSDNYHKVVVGTVIGKVRQTGEVFEVKCLIKDSKTIDLIKSGYLCETSAVYISDGKGNRVYNSIAIVPKGYARLGRSMTLKAEANNYTMNPEDLKAIAEAVTAEFKVTEAEASAFDEKSASIKAEAYAQGLDEGKKVGRQEAEVLASAKGVGYEGADAGEASNFLVDNQFPGLRTEAMSVADLMLLVQAAMKSSSPKCETCGQEEVLTEAKKEMTMAESMPEVITSFDEAPAPVRKQLPRRVI